MQPLAAGHVVRAAVGAAIIESQIGVDVDRAGIVEHRVDVAIARRRVHRIPVEDAGVVEAAGSHVERVGERGDIHVHHPARLVVEGGHTCGGGIVEVEVAVVEVERARVVPGFIL